MEHSFRLLGAVQVNGVDRHVVGESLEIDLGGLQLVVMEQGRERSVVPLGSSALEADYNANFILISDRMEGFDNRSLALAHLVHQ